MKIKNNGYILTCTHNVDWGCCISITREDTGVWRGTVDTTRTTLAACMQISLYLCLWITYLPDYTCHIRTFVSMSGFLPSCSLINLSLILKPFKLLSLPPSSAELRETAYLVVIMCLRKRRPRFTHYC